MSPISQLLAGPLADQILEPAMAEGGGLGPVFGWLVGTGTGAGIGLLFVITGLMVAMVKFKEDEHGRFTPESVWRAWKDWDFGQKREPSTWLTLLARRMLNRLDG
ncbi:MAG: hypothetical protein E3J37_02935 [Anaerolineales bacterium]|nr:MAG: hypothetical protein E3J37_02935 [Anaerolineales bacterium]